MAQPPRTARLAGHGIHPDRLGCQGNAEADRHERDLPAVLENVAGAAAEGSRESAFCEGFAVALARGDGARPGIVPLRVACREARRSLREAISAGRSVE